MLDLNIKHNLEPKLAAGRVKSVKDGVARILFLDPELEHLDPIGSGNVVKMGREQVLGLALNIKGLYVDVVILGNDYEVVVGDIAFSECKLFALNISESTTLGRVLDPLGRYIDFPTTGRTGDNDLTEGRAMRVERQV